MRISQKIGDISRAITGRANSKMQKVAHDTAQYRPTIRCEINGLFLQGSLKEKDSRLYEDLFRA